MSKEFTALPYEQLRAGTSYHRPPQKLAERVGANDPATEVMTDFTQVSAMTIGPCANLAEVEQRMIASEVRLLLVTDQNNQVLGLITTTDLQGEKPMKYLQEVGGKREEIFVRDIMTPQEKLDVLYMDNVRRARVGDIVETLKRVGRQHALVVDRDEAGDQIVRGIFSTTQISRQLGVNVEPAEVAKTFAELEAALD